jgi:hypothetical protein
VNFQEIINFFVYAVHKLKYLAVLIHYKYANQESGYVMISGLYSLNNFKITSLNNKKFSKENTVSFSGECEKPKEISNLCYRPISFGSKNSDPIQQRADSIHKEVEPFARDLASLARERAVTLDDVRNLIKIHAPKYNIDVVEITNEERKNAYGICSSDGGLGLSNSSKLKLEANPKHPDAFVNTAVHEFTHAVQNTRAYLPGIVAALLTPDYQRAFEELEPVIRELHFPLLRLNDERPPIKENAQLVLASIDEQILQKVEELISNGGLNDTNARTYFCSRALNEAEAYTEGGIAADLVMPGGFESTFSKAAAECYKRAFRLMLEKFETGFNKKEQYFTQQA